MTPTKVLFTDIDDTLTTHGKLPAESYEMLWKLQNSGIEIVPVTGRPAGWCEMIARLWPVLAVVGENGAFSFQYKNKKMLRHYLIPEGQRLVNRRKLNRIEKEILDQVPGAAIASDQFTRLFDLAIDFCEDVPALSDSDISKIVNIFEKHGATAKVSSIHVNGWFGDYDKRKMCEIFFETHFNKKLSESQSEVAFIGDSPNDEPLFHFFDHSVAVANILHFEKNLKDKPTYVCKQEGGLGFVEFGERLLQLQ